MKYQNILPDGKVQCAICPRRCVLAEGQEGFCHVRRNVGQDIKLLTYGYNTGLAIDPIEKKPLYHFYPGSAVLSFGTLGCNMGCLFCQNWHISKSRDDPMSTKETSPHEIVAIAKKYECQSVAFTYNDPIVFFEYAVDTAHLCRKNGIKTVAVTAGFINPEPAKEFFQYMDAANIDLKGFSEDFYAKNCRAQLQPILDTIKYAVNETDCHVELTTLLIEGENDSPDEIKAECEWILKNLGDCVPLHFSAFFPRFKFNDRKPTDFETLVKAYDIAKSAGLKYVYTGNLSTVQTSTTYCKKCGKPLIVRNGYQIQEYHVADGKCEYCSTLCDGRF